LGFSIVELLKYLFLGLIQGITEVLPVSSSGHVELSRILVGLEIDQNVIFLILLNTGSLFTFIIIYFKRLVELIKSLFIYIFKPTKRFEHQGNAIFLLKIFLACVPAGIAGIFLNPIIEHVSDEYGILLAGVGLLVTATVIYYVSTIDYRRGKKEVGWWDSLFIGLAQAVAIFPGISRSGMTTSTAIKRGAGINNALNFSFLMYIFISIASMGLLVIDFTKESATISNVQIIYYIVAFLGAMAATYVAYKLIFNIFRSGKLKYFSYYCFAIGLLAVILFVI
jgi:undecaprenyl-diphosphatase